MGLLLPASNHTLDPNSTFFLNLTVIANENSRDFTEDEVRDFFHKVLIVVFLIALIIFVMCQVIECYRRRSASHRDRVLEMRLKPRERS
uniref:Small integral membrane protein 32 n=1 Tax=Bursaphelenchus xylophilus TaxID=6326 RepID=A0A1I7RQP9_BURXY